MAMQWIDWTIVAVVTAFVTFLAWGTKKYTKSVADFLSANRCAGKYLLGIADGISGLGAISIIAYFQEYYEAGFTGMWWGWMRVPLFLMITLSGWVIYRFRATRAMTMAQFFEVRYSRKFRIFAGIVAFVSGIINFGIFPAVTARFFLSFCGLPEYFPVMGLNIETYPVVIALLISIALLFTFMGGQITVIVTDFVQGFFVNIMFIVILGYLLTKISWDQIAETLAATPEGLSTANPFDTGKIENFNFVFYAVWSAIIVYQYKAWQGSQAYNSSAKSAHVAKMAGILGTFREFGQMLFLLMLPICAYTLLHHADFSSEAAQINGVLDGLENPEVRNQMITPVAIRHLLPVGLIGGFAAVMVVASISVHDTYLHSWGSIFIQDIVMPFRKEPLDAKAHIMYLRLAIIGVAAFIFLWGWLVPQFMPIRYFFLITGQLYIGGAGTVIIGGLYWKYGTTAAAWTSMIVGGTLACSGAALNFMHDNGLLAPGTEAWVNEHAAWLFKIPWVLLASMICSVLSYVVVSLITWKGAFDMDAMLHRGKHRSKDKDGAFEDEEPAWGWRAFGMGKEFSKGDKVIYVLAMGQALATFGIFLIGTTINLAMYGEISNEAWIEFWKYYVLAYFTLSVIVTVWLSIGGLYDLRDMYAQLRTIRRDVRDDGTVVNHHNLDEDTTAQPAPTNTD
jgi:SSS family solute:Na+ symporter